MIKLLEGKLILEEDGIEYEECENGLNESLDLSKVSSVEELTRLAKDIKEDGTYEITSDGKFYNVDVSGYQASFFRPEMTDKDFRNVLTVIGDSLGNTYCGVYEGVPELSFSFNDKNRAIEFANIFNQESVWDNSNNELIMLNESPDRVDYDKAIEKLKKFLNIAEAIEESSDDTDINKKYMDNGIAGSLNDLIVTTFSLIDKLNSTVLTLSDNDFGNFEHYKNIKDVIDTVLNDENIHIGQLQEALKYVSPSAELIDDGKEEVLDNETEIVEVEENSEEDK